MISWGNLITALTASVHYRVPGAGAVAPPGLSGLRPPCLTRWHGPQPGWISSQARNLADELRSPGAVYVFQFWGVRFLLGLAEAGFYPGVIVYLTHWFPKPRSCPGAGAGSSSERRSRR